MTIAEEKGKPKLKGDEEEMKVRLFGGLKGNLMETILKSNFDHFPI